MPRAPDMSGPQALPSRRCAIGKVGSLHGMAPPATRLAARVSPAISFCGANRPPSRPSRSAHSRASCRDARRSSPGAASRQCPRQRMRARMVEKERAGRNRMGCRAACGSRRLHGSSCRPLALKVPRSFGSSRCRGRRGARSCRPPAKSRCRDQPPAGSGGRNGRRRVIRFWAQQDGIGQLDRAPVCRIGMPTATSAASVQPRVEPRLKH